MKFEVISRDGKTMMWTNSISCIPTEDELECMIEYSRYSFKLDGKAVQAKTVKGILKVCASLDSNDVEQPVAIEKEVPNANTRALSASQEKEVQSNEKKVKETKPKSTQSNKSLFGNTTKTVPKSETTPTESKNSFVF